ncbi:MAG: serine/threonine-protein kinase, partial [Chromatiales bacterium]
MANKTYANALSPACDLAGYQVRNVLGQGTFGITYLCQDVQLDRPVAVKEFFPGGFASRGPNLRVRPLSSEVEADFRDGLQRFLREARTLARFEHPNIVRVHHVFEANGTAYIVMNYEEGETLQKLLQRRRTLTEEEILRLLSPILGALEAIHQAGFIHRDIKPG